MKEKEHYVLFGEYVIRRSDKAFIPVSDNNVDYEEYKFWLSNGGIPGIFDFNDLPNSIFSVGHKK